MMFIQRECKVNELVELTSVDSALSTKFQVLHILKLNCNIIGNKRGVKCMGKGTFTLWL